MKETIVDEDFIERMNAFREKPSGQGLFEACSENVVLFAEHMLGIKLRAWQIFFLRRLQDAVEGRTKQRKFLALTSRQVGKTLGTAIFALWCVVFNKYPGGTDNRTIIGMVSATDRQAKKLLDEINNRIISGDQFMRRTYKNADGTPMFPPRKVNGREVGFFTALLDETQPNNTTTITFKPYKPEYGALLRDSRLGSTIMSFPPTNVVLGWTFTIVWIDEAGSSEDITDDFYYKLAPTFDEYNALVVMTSTPWQPSGFFYEFADPEETRDTPFDRVTFSIDCVRIEAPERYKNTMEEIGRLNAAGKIDEVQRAYYCRFVKGEASYFMPDKVDDIFEDYPMLYEYKGLCDMGIDYGGQQKSRTTVTITKQETDGTVRRLYKKTYPVQRDLGLIDDVAELLKVFNVQRIIPDECPQGDYFNRIMKEEKGWNIHPMNFRSDKVKKYGAFRAAVNKGKVKSFEDPELRTEMKALEMSNSSKQSIIQAAPGYTDDLIDGFVMSCYFFVQDEDKFNFYDLETGEEEDKPIVVAPKVSRWWKK